MSLLGLFNIGRTALFASQTALQVTSNNIANVNTPGYSRQEVILSVGTPVIESGGSVGTGVTISGIRRQYDRFMQVQLLGQYQNQGRSFGLNQALGQVEQIFNEAKQMGIASPLTDYFNAWNDVSLNPEGQVQRMGLLQKANTLVNVAKEMERGITENLRQLNQEISGIVGQVNSLASSIAILNSKIVQIEAGNSTNSANDLRDQRDSVLNQLSNLMEITTMEDNNGSVTVFAGMRNLVSGEKTNALSVSMNQDGDNELYLDNINITGQIQRGKLGGLIAARGEIESDALKGLRKLIASITKEINIQHSSGFGLDGTTGNNFFNPLQLATGDYSAGADISASISDITQVDLSEYTVTFDAANNYYVNNKDTGAVVTSGAYVSGNPITFDGIQITITGAITSADTFSVSPLTNAIQNFGTAITDFRQVAAASSALTLPGDNTNAVAIKNLADITLTDLSGNSFMNFYKEMVSNVATMSRAASDSLRFEENLLAETQNRREAVSGVSLDEEAANLIRFQRSFEAGARMIKVTDELLQTVLNL